MESNGKGHGRLVITRKAGQGVKIGDDIEVYVSEIRGNQLRLAISAPGLKVNRTEVWERERMKGQDDGKH